MEYKMEYNNGKRRFSLLKQRKKVHLAQNGSVVDPQEVMALLNIYESLIFHLSLMGQTANDGVFKAFDLKTYLKMVGESEQPSQAALREFSGLVIASFGGIYKTELQHATQTFEKLSSPKKKTD